jgi:hypothetical protein
VIHGTVGLSAASVEDELPLGRLEAFSDGVAYLVSALYPGLPARTIHRLLRR